MMTLQQINFHMSGLPGSLRALILPALFTAAVLSVSWAGTFTKTAHTATATLVDTTNVEASICTGIAYEFGDLFLTESGIYTETFTASDGSDSVVVLTLTVLPAPVTELAVTLCDGASYNFYGETLTEAGVYAHTLSTPDGCDSIIELSLSFVPFFEIELTESICAGDTVFFGGAAFTESGTYVDSLTASGGCDSVVTLVLTVLPHSETSLNAGVCEGFTYVFNGDTLDQSGMYVHVLPSANGCDSIVTLNLVVAAFFETELAATICTGESYAFGGQNLTESGIYIDSLQAAGGCDSTLILTLTVLPPTPTTFVDATICANETYQLGDEALQDPGTYTATFTGSNGCDSTVVLDLTVLPTAVTDLAVTICSNENYEIAGVVLTEAGNYTYVFQGENGCDSTVNLTLTVLDAPEIQFHETICNGETYTFEGEVLDASGTYTVVYTAENGCDSTLTLVLDILPVLESSLDATICAGESYAFDGNDLTDPGTYTAVLTSEIGCDSTVTLNLAVAPLEETAVAATICAGTSFEFNGETLTEPGEYVAVLSTVFGCDSTVTLTLSVLDPIPVTEESVVICANESYPFHGLLLTDAGTYEVALPAANGCDSVIMLTLEVLPVALTQVDASICAGETFEFAGEILSESGTYTETLTGANGCDSLTVLELTVLPVFETTIDAAICANETYEFQGEELSVSGTYSVSLTAENGCDSTVVLNLAVLPLSETQLNASICSNETYAFGGQNLSAPGVYTDVQTSENGCDSTIVLILDVLEAPVTNIQATICSNQIYDFNGEPLTQTGIYAQVFPAENGCDSTVVLNLSVLPIAEVNVSIQICEGSSYPFDGQDLTVSGSYFAILSTVDGCDSLVTLDLAVLDTLVTSISAEICAGDSYLFNGEELTETGFYEAFFTAGGNCDSLVQLTLTVLPVSSTDLTAEICAGETYEFNGEELTETGVYALVLTNALGCDSTITLALTVLPASNTAIEAAICAGESYNFNGEDLTEEGTYTALLTNAVGCDSTVALTLSVLPVFNTALDVSICAGDSYSFNGQELVEAGVYTALLTSSAGCDSTVTLTLSLLPPSLSILGITICEGESYEFNGEILSDDGIYVAVFTGANGCDSTVVLDLAVLPVSKTDIEATICAGETYAFQGQQLDVAGTYSVTLTSSNGCDSLVVLELSVLPTAKTELSANICAGDTYEFNGQQLSDPGVYTYILVGTNGCDSTVALTLTVTTLNTTVSLQGNTLTAAATDVGYQWIDCQNNQPIAGATSSSFTPAVTGNYAVVITSADGCSATSDCITVTIVGTKNLLDNVSWQIQPNPARQESFVQLEEPTAKQLLLELYDQAGRLALRQIILEGESRIALDLNGLGEGVYLVRLTDGRQTSVAKRLIKVAE